MQAELEFGWLSFDCLSVSDLTEVLELACTLRGQPVYWDVTADGVILASHFGENCGVPFKPFMIEPSAKELAKNIWSRLGPDWAKVRVPFRPDMGGIGGWNALHMLLWTSSPVCLILAQRTEIANAG